MKNAENKNNITELVFILDRSGSMAGLEADTIGGFNAMLEKQKKQDGLCWVSTVLFSNESQTIHDRVRLEDVKPMTRDDYVVGGCTALIDAIGDAIQHIAGMNESSIIISINTDPDAPINAIADYVITGAVEDVIPRLIKHYKKNSK